MSKHNELFSDNEREEIRRAVKAAEATTAGEIVALVTPESDRYREAEVLGGVLLAVCISLLVGVMVQHISIWFFVPAVFALFFPCRLLFIRYPRLKLPLLSRARRESAVRERCVQSFYEKGLHRTRHETGVLIFISELERKVWIIGDRGIDERIPPETWRGLVGDLTAGLREGRASEALCAVIASCGGILTEHFPKSPDDVNELPDAVIKCHGPV